MVNMLILPLLILLCAAGFCHSKAFREYPKHRSKRASDHGQGAVHFNKDKKYYYPEVDGHPIILPSADGSPSTFNELLDEYFKKFSYLALSTPIPNFNDVDHVTPEAIEKINIKKGQQSIYVYDSPKVVDKINIKKGEQFISNYDIPEVDKINIMKGGQSMYHYDIPEVVDKINIKKGGQSMYHYDTPEVVDKINIKKGEQSISDYEQPIIRDTVKAVIPNSEYKEKKKKPSPTPDYEDTKTVQTTRNMSKGKRRKQSQVVKKHGMSGDYETSTTKFHETMDDSYYPQSKIPNTKLPIKTKEKVIVKTQPKEPPIKTKEKVVVKTQPEQPLVKETVHIDTEDEYGNSEKVVVNTHSKEPPTQTKEKVVVKTQHKESSVKEKVAIDTYEDEYENSENVVVKTHSKEPPVKIKDKVVVKTHSKETPVKTKEKVVIKTHSKEPPVKTKEKVVVKTQPKKPPIKEKVEIDNEDEYENSDKVVVKTQPEEPPVKTKEKVVVKTHSKEPPVKTKEKVVVKTHSKEPPVKTKEKVVVKTQTPKKPPVKEKVPIDTNEDEYENSDVVKTQSKEPPIKTKEKVVVKTRPKKPPIKEKVEIDNDEYENSDKVVVKTQSKDPLVKTKENVVVKTLPKEPPLKENVQIKTNTDEYENVQVIERRKFTPDTDLPLEESTGVEDLDKDQFLGGEIKNEPLNEDIHPGNSQSDLESSEISTVIRNQNSTNTHKFLPNIEAVQKLASLNSNIWSLIFNPNAESLKLQKCITRNNETGFCTYIQHCEVPGIATSLEQLLNNACVIDDVFIGVCCPEFPVESVKVHWEQNPSDSNARIEDEFGHDTQDCGIRSDESSKLQTWPWKAPLVSASNGKIFCGGVIISEEYILTAAHCTTKIPRNQILVRLGQVNDGTGEDYAVVEIKRHAQYNPRTLHDDIALLRLGRRIMHSTHVGVVCLPESEDRDDDGDEDEHDGENALLLGWKGIFGTKSKDPESLKVMSNEECEKKLGQRIPSSFLCTEARDENERSCNADSGAPLVIEDDGKYEVIGILSWNRNDCDQRFPSTFSRVSSYIGWIQKHIV